MTMSHLYHLRRLTTHLREEANDYSSSDADADSSADESIEEVAEEIHDLSDFFLGTAILRERLGDSSSGQRREDESYAAAVVNMNTSCADNAGATSNTERTTSNPQNPTDDDDAPPSPWQHSTATEKYFADTHLFLGPYGPKNWKLVKCDEIRRVYAERYPRSNFRENLKRLLLHFQNGTGDFSPEKTEQWYTSPGNVSKAYSLLFSLYMDATYSNVLEQMTAEQIWRSHEIFQLYTLEDFTIYNKRMVDLTNKRKNLTCRCCVTKVLYVRLRTFNQTT